MKEGDIEKTTLLHMSIKETKKKKNKIMKWKKQ